MIADPSAMIPSVVGRAKRRTFTSSWRSCVLWLLAPVSTVRITGSTWVTSRQDGGPVKRAISAPAAGISGSVVLSLVLPRRR